MKILAIDTSCDDTSVAIIATEKPNSKQQLLKIKILSNVVSSQIKIHSPYGGVYPALAKREHQHNLAPVCKKALQKAKFLNLKVKTKNEKPQSKIKKLKTILNRDELLLETTEQFLLKYQKPKVNAIAITNTPGLEPCLWQGINFACALSLWWELPIIPVNHIKAHLAANWLTLTGASSKIKNQKSKLIKFPAIGLVASGGHTELIYMPEIGRYQLIGSTRDDAAGECFDKTARILGLPYPGGPSLALQAKLKIKNQKLKIKLPRPMINSGDFDFSFSGLKTAVLYNFQSQKKSVRESKDYKIAMAKEIQQAIIDVLVEKTLKAAQQFKAKSIITGGGVMANKELRRQLKIQNLELKIPFFVPKKSLCLDNAAMVGAESLLSNTKSKSWQKIKASGNLKL
ncbi:MAG: tRNA (adenosine(37)-N6)-threonylcarbamoyltransferase complex transferase subunit TsaD [Candidatus Pacebacteria bacterium]|nr:tRNA (adenosine(37)-N6)-threonylcarbamoyltransferase complex transferase subunit TsaD [Candidatus Paceibacterota bacterium]